MLHLPRGRNEWIVAVVSALVGFFFGGAAIAGAQAALRKIFGITS